MRQHKDLLVFISGVVFCLILGCALGSGCCHTERWAGTDPRFAPPVPGATVIATVVIPVGTRINTHIGDSK